MYRSASQLLEKGMIRLPKVEHPKFEGRVLLNKDEYQKIIRLNFRLSLGSFIIHP